MVQCPYLVNWSEQIEGSKNQMQWEDDRKVIHRGGG